ncbi:aromatic ring-hydroxylating dioxygenase subunit alpha [Streptomyces sp. NPDC000594]|uniref:aromatic ring-hydroxylating oxygenase subunit alpha n=1 Tax=Streptomyces sp. NPDC000594 TaxID=3154261 RepID=UPI00332F5CD5
MAAPTGAAPDGGSLIRTLPGHAYSTPESFAREQERIFEALWFCALRSADLAAPGAFRTVPIGRENVLVVRNTAGELRAFLNVCSHRGTRLCTEESGTVRRTLRCPYHSWSYDLDGSLVAAPHLARMPQLDRGAHGLRPVALREWLGYAWLCLADRPPSFDTEVRGAVTGRLGDGAAIDHYRVDTLALGRRIRYDVRANWKLLIENFMECYHCPTIHPELVAVLPEFGGGYAAQTGVGRGVAFAEEARGFTVDGGEGFGRLPEIADHQDRRYFAITVRPQVFINLVPDHVIVHRMFPYAYDGTVIECDWLYAPEVIASGADTGRSVELFHRVNEQDFAVCERTQPGMASRAYRAGGVLVPAERHIGEFHSWVTGMLADPPGPPDPTDGPEGPG